jgi:predicted dehydrogenase/nucleoside-diphosphate-sugar epimerase
MTSTTLLEQPAESLSAEPVAPRHAPRRDHERRVPVAIVGAGYIAGYHVEVLRHLDIAEVVGVCDPDAARRDAFRREWQIASAATSLAELLRDCRPEAVHVLVPPPAHFEVAKQAIEAGLHVLVEKPMALRASECARLVDLARQNGVRLGVNHNAVFHPAFRRLLDDVGRRKLGRIEHVVSINNLPLAQLDSGDHDHWMFRAPENILFEQATHPLSQIHALLGPVSDVDVARSGPRTLKTGAVFHTAWQMSLTCERGTAQLFIAFGRHCPEAVCHVIGQDGSARIDLLKNTYTLDRATKYFEPLDRALRSLADAANVARGASTALLRYVVSTLRLRRRTDPYYISMLRSIEAFYRPYGALGDSTTAALAGLEVVAASEMAARKLTAVGQPPVVRSRSVVAGVGRPSVQRRDGEVLVLGGSGFIGRHVIAALARAGRPVRVLTRHAGISVANDVDDPPVVRHGDIRNRDDVTRAVDGCRGVIHLVTGAPATWSEYERLFVQGTRTVAEACLQSGVEQLLFASSIAVYYLGNERETITEDTPLDDNPRRGEYTRAKIAGERVLTEMHRDHGLSATIFRPGVVIGAGGPSCHLGVGYWPTPTHCISWGLGTRRPLPFVLVDDVADALSAAVGRSDLGGRSFNLVGDVRLSAEEYLETLRQMSSRDIRLHRQAILKWYGVDVAKWAVKAIARKPGNAFPSYRNFASWALAASFDCSRAKTVLGWKPVADRQLFIELGVHRAVRDA